MFMFGEDGGLTVSVSSLNHKYAKKWMVASVEWEVALHAPPIHQRSKGIYQARVAIRSQVAGIK